MSENMKEILKDVKGKAEFKRNEKKAIHAMEKDAIHRHHVERKERVEEVLKK